MAKDNSSLLILGGVGVLAWYGYTKGWFASFGLSPVAAAPAATPSTPVMPTTAPTTSTPMVPATPPPTPSAPAAPSYSGPSLSQMFSSLQAVVQAAYGSDSALSCAGAVPVGPTPSNPPASTVNTGSGSHASMSGFGDISTDSTLVASGSPLPATCANPISTKDVFNWYLVNRANVGISSGPSSNSDQTPLSLTDYWAWAAPQLQTMHPGLSGYGSIYAGLGEITRRLRGW